MPPHVVENILGMLIGSVTLLSVTGITAWTFLRVRQSRHAPPAAGMAELQERLARLEQAVDAVAVEVERSGEAQRFTARLLAERLGEDAVRRVPDASPERAIAAPRPTTTPH